MTSIYSILREGEIGIGLDSCLIPLKRHNLSLIQTTDCFYPLVDNPYVMGKITCANVLSDLYAMGVVICDHLVILFSVCTQMSEKERDVVIPLFVRGFREKAMEAGVEPSCQSVNENPWLLMGGVATTICNDKEYLTPLRATNGDVLILTKPLGAEVMRRAYQNICQDDVIKDEILKVTSLECVKDGFTHAMMSMERLNKTAALLMYKYDAHAATDVTGFGLLGHAENLAKEQTEQVEFVIDSLPYIEKSYDLAVTLKMKRYLEGYGAETSGGLLIAIPKHTATQFCTEIAEKEDWPAWIIGSVVATTGERTARITDSPNIINAPIKQFEITE
ncbi:Selenophosphate synthetase 1 [Carabus blaptoides fortunei]